MFLLRITARPSPGRLATSRLERGRLATSHLGSHRLQQQSRLELISSCYGAFARLCMRSGIRNGNSSHTAAVQLVPASGTSEVDPFNQCFICCFLLVWELSCLVWLPPRAEYNAISGTTAAQLGEAAAAHPPDTSFDFQPHPRKIQSQEQRHNSSERQTIESYTPEKRLCSVSPPFNPRHPRDFKSTT